MAEPEPIRITLSPSELREAALVGVERAIQNISRTTNQKRGADRRWMHRFSYDIVGAAGERVVAKYLNIPWNGCLGDWTASDVGPYEVRCRQSHRYDLSLYMGQDDTPEKATIPYVLVTTEDASYRTYFIRGWAFSYEITLPFYWREPPSPNWTGGPCWLFPAQDLAPMNILPPIGPDRKVWFQPKGG